MKETLELKKLELEEISEIYGTASIDYGSDLISEFIGNDYQSATFPSHLSKDLVSEPKNLSTNLFYEMGRTKLNEEKLKDAKTNGDVDSILKVAKGLNVLTDDMKNILGDTAADLSSQITELKQRIERLTEVVTTPTDELSNLEPITLSDGSVFDVEAFQDLFYNMGADPSFQAQYEQQRQMLDGELQQLRSQLDELMQKASAFDSILEEKKAPSEQYQKLLAASKDPKALAEELIKYSFARRSQQITSFVMEGENAITNNLTYFKDTLAMMNLAMVQTLRKYYSPRTDISARTKSEILATLDDLEQRLQKVLEYAIKNKQTRQEIQVNAMKTQGVVMENVLDLDAIANAINTGDENFSAQSPITQIVYDVMSLPDNVDKFNQIYDMINRSKAEGSPSTYKIYQALLHYVASNVSEQDKKNLYDDIDSYAFSLARETFPNYVALGDLNLQVRGLKAIVGEFYNVPNSIH